MQGSLAVILLLLSLRLRRESLFGRESPLLSSAVVALSAFELLTKPFYAPQCSDFSSILRQSCRQFGFAGKQGAPAL